MRPHFILVNDMFRFTTYNCLKYTIHHVLCWQKDIIGSVLQLAEFFL
jgi:hypothetical protein